MINRARARRAFDVTLFLLLVLTSSFGQVLFKTRQERSRVKSDAAEQAGTPALPGVQTVAPSLPEVSYIAAQEGATAPPDVEQQARRNVGAFFEKLRAGAPVTIAYMGGPVTAGAGASVPEKTSFRALVTEWLRKHYPKSEITELNAAINNTGVSGGSLYGA